MALMQKLLPGAKIHIWTDKGKTLMHIDRTACPYDWSELGGGLREEFILLSDSEIPDMGCNLHFEVKEH